MRCAFRRRPCFPQVIESLERRRLLSYTYDATPGNDNLEITGDLSNGTTIRNSAGASVTTLESVIFINLLAGNDRVEVKTLFRGAAIVVNGGDGDDAVEYLRGNLANDVNGEIIVEDGAGSDRLTVLDNSSAPDHGVPQLYEDRYFVNGPAGGSATVQTRFGIEVNTLTLGALNNQVMVSEPTAGLQLFLGGGNDTVTYFGDDHVMPATIGPMQLFGDAGTDTVIFDDSAGGATSALYTATNSAILDQTLTGMESATIRSRSAQSQDQSSLDFTGIPALNTINIESATDDTITRIGTVASPIDLDAHQVTINKISFGTIELHEQNADVINFAWEVYTSDNATRQHIGKGFFDLNCTAAIPGSTDDALYVYSGSTNDEFQISGQIVNQRLLLHAGGGADRLVTANRNGHQNDLDAIFFNDSFNFYGEAGIDRVELDDTADASNDGDPAYAISEYEIAKGDFSDPGANRLVELTARDVEQIAFTAPNDDNAFEVAGFFDTHITIVGNGGNDTFYNRATGGLAENMSIDATMIGGPGTDLLLLSDAVANDFPNTDYQLSSAAFVASRNGNPRGTFRYDATIEKIDITLNVLPTTTRILGKPATTELKITDTGGNDNYIVGGGDLDASGLRLSNTNIIDPIGAVDAVTFDDTLDTNDDAALETLVVQNQFITKDAAGVNFSGLEAQTFLMGSAGTGGVNQINISSMAPTIGDTQVIGGNTRPTAVNVANGLLSTLSGTMTIDLNGGGGSINVNNQNATANADYTITSALIDGPYAINIADVQLVQINAGSGADRFFINNVPAGREVDAFGNNGNDEFYAGNGALASLAGNVLLVGGGGSDFMRFSNSSAVGTTAATMTASTFTFGAVTHSYTQMETAQITGSALGSTFDIQSLSTGMNATVTGAGAADVVRFGGGDMDVAGSTLTFNGGNGSDRLELLDANDTGDSDVYTFSTIGALDRMTKTAGTITVVANSNDVERRVLNGSAGSTLVQVNSTNSDLDINANGGDDNVRIDDAVARIVVNTGDGIDSLTVNADAGTQFDVPAQATIVTSDDVRNLDIKAAGVLHIESDGVLAKSHAAGAVFNLQGTIDLNGGAMIARSGGPALSTFRSWIALGRNGGAWNGSGGTNGVINSSLAASTNTGVPDAIGYGSGTELLPLRFGDFNVATGDVALRYTYVGDADLNRVINFDDYARIDAGFNLGRSGWTNGDFDFNNVANFDDYALIDLAFNGLSRGAPSQRGAGRLIADM